jgi:hypothetical protein
MVTAVVVVLAPAAGHFSERLLGRQKLIERRLANLQNFFGAGGELQHPALREASFAVAVGHDRIGAKAIPLLLRQHEPSRFIRLYVRARAYLVPSEDGTKFNLDGLAKHASIRRTLFGLGFAAYLSLVFMAMYLVLFRMPSALSAGAWKPAAADGLLAVVFAGAGLWSLTNASHLHWAKQLFDRQRES